MKIYKASYRTKSGESAGFFYASSLKEAKANKKVDYDITNCDREIEAVEVTPTKKGILKALNFHASHNDNG